MKGSILATNTYNIKRIPSNYMIDRQGMIVYRDLQGPELNKVVGQLTK